MTVASRLIRCPIPHDPDRAADALRHLSLDQDFHPLIAGAAGCSTYLAGLIQSEADWLPAAMDNPEQAVKALLSSLPALSLADLPVELRRAKRRIALIVALMDLGGVWPLEVVTQTLTDFADAAVHACMVSLVAAEIARGKLPGDRDHACASGMVTIAMGKMGAAELNYSSDIDLICLFDETQFDPDDYYAARTSFIRVTRRMTAILSDVSGGGYVFRTDLRLRPDSSVTPVCLSMEAAERYYESVGRTWERAAYIKARACAGDIAAGQKFLKSLSPFVWRKHLDFAAIQDAHDMRLKIRNHKGLHGPLVLEGHNMKLGRGGIREIEFFVQTRQLIAGGRDPSLRVSGTGSGLQALAKAGWLAQGDADRLYEDYRFHREVEHRLQMIGDQQTHILPTDTHGFARLAAFMGRDVAGLRRELTDRLSAVHELTEGFFAPDPAASEKRADDASWGADVTARWHSYPALRSPRATEIFARLTPDIMLRLQDAAKPQEALAQFDQFLAGLPAGVQLFSLFEANPPLLQLIIDIAATAPALSQYLSRNAAVLDAVIGGAFFDPWPGAEELTKLLGAALDAGADYETQLLTARRWAKEWKFRIGVHHLRGLIDANISGQQYADLAEAVVAALWPVITADFARKHGSPPGRGAIVVGMGSLGAARLNAGSDLDLIVIYDAVDVEMSDGRRPLATRSYYARLTQALVTALGAPMAEGRLYEVDMRLRPSGKQGPVATSLQSFRDYQSKEAWTWEHLALTRARPIAGPQALAKELEAFRAKLLHQKGKAPSVLQDVAEMRARIAKAKPQQDDWDPKIGAGRLQDTELFSQTAALSVGSGARAAGAQLAAGADQEWIDAAQADAVLQAAQLFWKVQATARLLTNGALMPDVLGEGGRRFLLRETGYTSMDDLSAAMRAAATQADAVISARLGEL